MNKFRFEIRKKKREALQQQGSKKEFLWEQLRTKISLLLS